MASHALVDGNKRLGWLAATAFLNIKGGTVELGDDEAFELVLAVAEGRLDVEDIANRLSINQTALEG